jgi:hypothetical protein
MKPGTRWTYRGVEPGSDPEDIVIVATTATKKLANGVTARVVRDTARAKGQIIEDTVDWYAQDSQGNVWVHGRATRRVRERQDRQPKRFPGRPALQGHSPASCFLLGRRSARSAARSTRRGEAEDNEDAVVTMDSR